MRTVQCIRNVVELGATPSQQRGTQTIHNARVHVQYQCTWLYCTMYNRIVCMYYTRL